MIKRFSNTGMLDDLLEAIRHRMLAPPNVCLLQDLWNRSQRRTFLISTQVVLMLFVQEPCSESHRCKCHILVLKSSRHPTAVEWSCHRKFQGITGGFVPSPWSPHCHLVGKWAPCLGALKIHELHSLPPCEPSWVLSAALPFLFLIKIPSFHMAMCLTLCLLCFSDGGRVMILSYFKRCRRAGCISVGISCCWDHIPQKYSCILNRCTRKEWKALVPLYRWGFEIN